MINLKISTCLTIAITLLLCVWGFSYKGTYTDIKYSLQGTTQGNGLTGGLPPVRFSM